jgi:hypothetical protein
VGGTLLTQLLRPKTNGTRSLIPLLYSISGLKSRGKSPRRGMYPLMYI